MNLWHRITGRKAAQPSDDGLTDTLRAILGGARTSKSGAIVSRQSAFRVAAVLACARVIAEGVAQVPFKVLQELPADPSVSRHPKVRSAVDHPLYDILHRAPNGWQTSFEFREQLILHALFGQGGAYAFKNVISVGRSAPRVAELILLDPSRVKVVQNADWSITYEVRGKTGELQRFPQESIWHVRGPSWDGVLGLDLLDMAREAIGLSLATEESHAGLHEKGVRPAGVYSVEGTLTPDQFKALRKWIEENNAGAENAGRVMVLDRSAKFNSMAMTGVDAQHLETRRYQVEEVCRFMRVLPIMIGYADKTATYASAEQMFLAHVVHTLMPWYERIQQSADINLLSPADRQAGYYTKLVEAGLLRGAMRDTAEYLYRLTQAGIMERNEARGKLDLNPLPGLDDPLTPTNMTTDPTGAPAATTGA